MASEALRWDEAAGPAGSAAGVWAGAEVELPHGAPPPPVGAPPLCRLHDAGALCDALRRWHHCPELHKAIDGINYIAEQTRKEEESTRVSAAPPPRRPRFPPALTLPFARSGEGGLEVRGDGPGPAVLVDLHPGRGRRLGGHHPAGADSVRRPRPH